MFVGIVCVQTPPPAADSGDLELNQESKSSAG